MFIYIYIYIYISRVDLGAEGVDSVLALGRGLSLGSVSCYDPSTQFVDKMKHDSCLQ